MTGRDILEKLIVHAADGTLTVEPGPFTVAISEADSLAAELLVMLADVTPPLTQGQVEEALLAALWWNTTLGTLKKAERTA